VKKSIELCEKDLWDKEHDSLGTGFSSTRAMGSYTSLVGGDPVLISSGKSVVALDRVITAPGLLHYSTFIGFSFFSHDMISYLSTGSENPVTAYICLHPLNDTIDGEEVDGTLFVVDTLEKLKMSKSVSYKIKSCKKKGVITSYEKSKNVVSMFYDLYSNQHHGKVGRRYTQTIQSIEALLDSNDTFVVNSHIPGTEERAMSIFGVGGECVDYFLSTSSQCGKDLQAWNVNCAIEECRKRKVRYLNLGGGIQEGDGLHHFKRRFGGKPFSKRVLKLILDKDRYSKAVLESGSTGDKFPPYL